MNPVTLLRLLETNEFQIGLIAGLVSFAVALVLRDRCPHFTLLFSFAAVAAIGWLGVFSGSVFENAFLRQWWILPAAVIAIAIITYGLGSDSGFVHPVWPTAVSLGGVWATVPDTEEAAVVLGVITGLLLMSILPRSAKLAFVGSEFLALIAVWVVAVGSLGRDGAIVGGLGTLASLALIRWRQIESAWWDLGLHVALVLVWSRVAGLRQEAWEAAALGITATVVIAAMRWQLARRLGHRPESGVTIVEHRPEPPAAHHHSNGGDDDGGSGESHQNQS